MLPAVVKEQRFSEALALVIARAFKYRVNVAPIALCSWVHLRVALYVTGGCVEYLRLGRFRQTQHINRTMHTRFRSLHEVMLIVNRRSSARQVINFIYFDIERGRDVVPN